MSRRRYITTQASLDKALAAVEKKYGDFAGLLYVRMIPHAEDDATITGDPETLLGTVFPLRRDKYEEDIAVALEGMVNEGLIAWDRENAMIYFPIGPFYKYQAYIGADKRRTWDYAPKVAKNGAQDSKPSELAEFGGNNLFPPKDTENGAHARTPSVSFSVSVPSSISSSVSVSAPNGANARIEGEAEQVEQAERAEPPPPEDPPAPKKLPHLPEAFAAIFKAYPRHGDEEDARKAWEQVKPSRQEVDKILALLAPFAFEKLSAEAKTSMKALAPWLRAKLYNDDVPFQGLEIYRRNQSSKPNGNRYGNSAKLESPQRDRYAHLPPGR